MILSHRAIAIFCLAAPLHAGILITRTAQGFQFADAAAILVNGKDKVLSLGADPASPNRKLQSVKLGGTLLQDLDAKVIASYEDGAIEYILPEGTPKNAPADAAGIWKTARIAYKRTANDKAPTEIPLAEFVAFLPEGPAQLARCATDGRALAMIGGKNRIFDTQLVLIAASVKQYRSDPAMASLDRFVAEAMRRRYDQFESGTVGVSVLVDALRFAQLSAEIDPHDAEHERLRNQLAARKAWLGRKSAVLGAFAAVQDWDDFLLADRDFERYQQAFPEIAKLHGDALHHSLEQHRQAGEERSKEGEFGAAYNEFRLASFRQPSDKILQQKVLMAWTDYSRRVASDRVGSRTQLSPGQREAINQALRFATGYKEQNKLDLALKSALEAEAIDAGSLPVLLKKAEILGAMGQFNQALKTLDEYDLRAVEEEREPASNLRNDLLFKRTSSIEDWKVQLRAAWSDGSYQKMRDLALRALSARDDDPELLYQAGLASLVTRHSADGKKFLDRYLEVSNTLDADQEQRVRARLMAASLNDAAAPLSGDLNWFSGMRLPAGVFYCPSSLAFQPRIERIDASNKMRVSFEWDGDRAGAIVPTFDKPEHATGEKRIAFAYDPAFPQVIAADYGGAPRVPSADPDQVYKYSSVILWNNPHVDPAAVQQLTGKNVAVTISGNRFFEPFVWDAIHYFRVVYDSRGRVAEAREVASPTAAPGDTVLEFEWDGLQLAAIRGYQGSGAQRRQFYERTMEYTGNHLVAEQVQSQGKTARIKYTYNGDKLTAAACDKDPSLDDRSRQVTFR